MIDSPQLLIYGISNQNFEITTADRMRDWMEETDSRFAYRCLPLLMANQNGWSVKTMRNIDASWDGGSSVKAITIEPKTNDVLSHFGHGILTWRLPFLFRTPPNINLIARGPANLPLDGISPLEGIIETDWSHATFTMNWKFTRPGTIQFVAGFPVCMIVPYPRHFIEQFQPTLHDMDDEPEMCKPYDVWNFSRYDFNEALQSGRSDAMWQKDYFKGRDVDGRIAEGHQTVLHLKAPTKKT